MAIIITSALPMGFLPDSHRHKQMINYSMTKLSPYPPYISMQYKGVVIIYGRGILAHYIFAPSEPVH